MHAREPVRAQNIGKGYIQLKASTRNGLTSTQDVLAYWRREAERQRLSRRVTVIRVACQCLLLLLLLLLALAA